MPSLQENLFFDSTAYGSFGTCMSFMMVFRTAQSYTRYWVAWVKSLPWEVGGLLVVPCWVAKPLKQWVYPLGKKEVLMGIYGEIYGNYGDLWEMTMMYERYHLVNVYTLRLEAMAQSKVRLCTQL